MPMYKTGIGGPSYSLKTDNLLDFYTNYGRIKALLTIRRKLKLAFFFFFLVATDSGEISASRHKARGARNFESLKRCYIQINHKNYNFLNCDWFKKKLLFSNYSLVNSVYSYSYFGSPTRLVPRSIKVSQTLQMNLQLTIFSFPITWILYFKALICINL